MTTANLSITEAQKAVEERAATLLINVDVARLSVDCMQLFDFSQRPMAERDPLHTFIFYQSVEAPKI